MDKTEEKFKIIFEKEDGYYFGHCEAFPCVFGEGKTKKECKADTLEAICGLIIHINSSHIPNKLTIEAIENIENNIGLHEVDGVEGLFKELGE